MLVVPPYTREQIQRYRVVKVGMWVCIVREWGWRLGSGWWRLGSGWWVCQSVTAVMTTRLVCTVVHDHSTACVVPQLIWV